MNSARATAVRPDAAPPLGERPGTVPVAQGEFGSQEDRCGAFTRGAKALLPAGTDAGGGAGQCGRIQHILV